MSLFTSFGSFNRRVDEALVITYTANALNGSDYVAPTVGTEYALVRITRHARKVYRYIGMTQEAAQQCAIYKYNKYSRLKAIGRSVNNTLYVKQCQADIIPRRTDGDMWECVVNVNEVDDKIMMVNTNISPDFDSYFGIPRAFYDEDSEYYQTPPVPPEPEWPTAQGG